ncbi:MAG: filamentous hemagglutinin N-terminal domain-containing protein [Moorea sp. SIO3I6]|nr:filamentous hemagglutinin N-terminal domain-containing protein [Moorena sp. SIO3I6]
MQRCYLLGHILVSSILIPNIATAQISSDGTLSTTVTSDDGVNFLIEKGVRTWDHLFHSFSEFSVPSNGSAFFNNAGDIVNIFSRVTGGNIYNIDGLIRANGNANLFLINPAGIIFGENASLNIGGSFLATTAESVVFGDGIEFSATEPNQAPLLTINITPGLQMGTNPGNITVVGPGHTLNGSIFTPFDRSNLGSQLQVQPGNTLALVGLIESSLIQANANLGNGGDITITTQGLFVFPDSAITASSEFGLDGLITINNPDADPANGLIELPTELRDRTQQIAKGCGWTATSSFYITGRGGIPQDPSAMVPGGQILSDVRDISDLSIVRAIPEAEDRKAHTNTKAPIVEANAWIINEEGNVELVAVVNSNQALDFLRATCAIKED